MLLWNAESPAAAASSVAFTRATGISQSDQGMTFTAHSPVAATVNIQASNEDVDGQYQTLYTLVLALAGGVNPQYAGSYTDTTRFKFYRANLVSGVGPVTVEVQR